MGNCVSSPEKADKVATAAAAPVTTAKHVEAFSAPVPANAVEAASVATPAATTAATTAAAISALVVSPVAAAVDIIKPAEAILSTDATEVVLKKEHELDELALVAAGEVVAANPEGGAVNASAVPDALIGNLLDPENGPAKGLAYEVHYLGPPRPPCEEARQATTDALHRIDGTEDPEIANILRVISGIFEAPVSLCALFDKKRVFISDAAGGVVPRGDFPWRWTLCGWSLAFTSPMILVIPDTHEDARFRDNHKVTKEPNVRFYCGAPLIASNGHRLGTLCFVDVKPRILDAASCMIMNNFSELVVRQLEKDIVLEAASKENSALVATYGKLERTIDAFEHCVVLLDTHALGWKLVFANAAFNKVTGVVREKALAGVGLCALFEGIDTTELPTADIIQSAAAGKSFELVGARLKAEMNPSAETFVLRFRPAGKDFLDEATMPIGVPAFLPTTGGMHSSDRFYFLTIDLASSIKSTIGSNMSTFSLLSSVGSRPENMEGLEMGHLLGKGSFGSVYYGTWFGTPVAVKIIEADLRSALAINGVSLEAVLSTNLRHPLIVSTLKYTVKSIKPSTKSDGPMMTGSSFNPTIAEDGSAPSDGAGGWGVITFETNPGATPGGAQMPTFEMGSANTWGGNSSSTFNSVRSISSTACATPHSQTWMIMEYCDKGSLQDAIDRGWLMASRSCLSGSANMDAVIATATELASALNYLHSKDVVHGDLSGWNCMLSSAGSTASVGGRNFVAKIADFGLSRTLDVQSKIQTRNYGTMTHMPPETLISGVISKATDVYSFGVLMWQMFTASRPWCGLSHAQIIMQVGTQGAKLQWPKSVPSEYRALSSACMDAKPELRPKFEDIVSQLDRMQKGDAVEGDL